MIRDYVVRSMMKGFLKAHGDLIVKSEANDRVVKYSKYAGRRESRSGDRRRKRT